MSGFRKLVLALVAKVPRGKVATYGQIAMLAGKPGAARQVGMILRGIRAEEDIPWQRIINAQGSISTYKIGAGELQTALLKAEGIEFSDKGYCDLKRFGWRPKISPLDMTVDEETRS